MNRKLLMVVLMGAVVLVTGCIGGGSSLPSLVTVSGTLQYQGDMEDPWVTVGLGVHATMVQFQPAATETSGGLMQHAEPLWEAHYELQVPRGTYILWLSGYGLAASPQEVSVTGNQTVHVHEISQIGMAATGTFYFVGQYAEIYVDIWDSSFETASFSIVDSSLSQSFPALLDYDYLDVPLSQVEVGKNIFVEVQANGQTYYLPALFIDAPRAINFARDQTIPLPYTLRWEEVAYATDYHFGMAIGTCNWGTNPWMFHNEMELHVPNQPEYYTQPGPNIPSCTISLFSYRYVGPEGEEWLAASARRDFPGIWFAPPLD